MHKGKICKKEMRAKKTGVDNTSSQKGNMPTNVFATRATRHTGILDQHRRKKRYAPNWRRNTSSQKGNMRTNRCTGSTLDPKMGNVPE